MPEEYIIQQNTLQDNIEDEIAILNAIEDLRLEELLDHTEEAQNRQVAQNEQIVQNLLHRPDSQNVHETIIQNTTSSKYKRTDDIIDHKKIFEQITELAKKKNKPVDSILQQISKRNAHIYNLNDHEVDVICNTWINGSKNTKEQIINELVDCIENKNLVCPTGVVTRIINADIVDNPDDAPKTAKYLREEMLNTAAKLRNDLEEAEGYKDKPQEEQDKQFKEKLIETYTQTYKDKIPIEKIEKEYKQWIDTL